MPDGPALKALEPRKAPVQARSAATVAIILEAAARILERDGLGGYSTNAVARVAGVSVGSLYQYFPGKDAITRALILEETRVLLAEVDAVDATAGGHDALRRIIAAAAVHQLRRPVLARLLDQEEGRLTPGSERRSVGDQLLVKIRLCLVASDLTNVSPSTAAADVLAIIKGMVDAAGARGETEEAPLRTRVERAVFGYLEAARPHDQTCKGPAILKDSR